MRPPIDVLYGPTSTVFDAALDREINSGETDWLWMAPPCATFSTLQNMRRGGPLRTPSDIYGHTWVPRVALGNACWLRALALARALHRRGGHFIIEHPARSMAWIMPETAALRNLPGIHLITLDQCAFGAPTRKPTRLLTNAPWILSLSRSCPKNHVHAAHLEGRAAAAAAAYPSAFTTAAAQARARWRHDASLV